MGNDTYSLEKKQPRGDTDNLVLAIEHEHGVSRDATLDISKSAPADLADEQPRKLPPAYDPCERHTAQHAVDRALSGGPPLHTVIHCAGISPLGRVLDQPAAQIERIMRVNHLGTVHIAKATAPHPVAQASGTFITIASIAGHLPLTSIDAHSAPKAAVPAFHEVLATERRGTGVRLVRVRPAAAETPMLKTLRITNPETINGKPASRRPKSRAPRNPAFTEAAHSRSRDAQPPPSGAHAESPRPTRHGCRTP